MRLKHFLSVFLTLLTLSVGQMWGDESWDLTTNSYSSSSTSTVTWSGTNATMTLEKNGGTNANNYLGGSGTYTHTRVYNNNILKITPASGKTISSIEITATSSTYTIVGTWTNGSASSSGSKTTITPTDGTKAVYCTCSDTKRLTGVVVKFGSSSALEQVTISGSPTLKNYEAGDVFDPAGLTVTGTYSNSTSSDVEDGISWTAYNGNSYVALANVTLTQGQTTLKVKATVGTVTSAEFTVTGLSVVAAYPKVTITQSQVTSFTNKYAEYSWSANSVSGKLNAYKSSGMQFNTSNNTTSTGYVYNTVAVPGKIVYITMTTASGTERSWTPYVSSSALTRSNYSTAGTALTSQTVKTTGTRWNVTGDNSYFYLLPPSSASVISSIVIAYESCTSLGQINGSFFWTTPF